MPGFPELRPRRLRLTKAIRDLVAETLVSPSQLMMPIFVKEGIKEPEPIPSMPGQYRYPPERVVDVIREALDLGIKSFLLFGVVPDEKKDLRGTYAYDPRGPVPTAIRLIRRELGWEPAIFTDVCICGYTTHGHCGIPVERHGRQLIDNDSTLEVIARIAVTHAEAGADFVAPSGMMDGMVSAIREALDDAGYTEVGIMSYAVKYASGFYGPFREAAGSAPRFGDRRSYQMDPRNAMEAIKEAMLDIEEGADILMVKPALAYLDVIRLVKEAFPQYPLAAYNVSAEYSMVKAAAEKGWIDEKLVTMEIITAIRRAGADIVITYHALDVARWLREGYSPF
ncbi:porphobilinogen synthase [Hyperthermus butylicus]|uniref:Delta-aminolevulinic acid dehydratase n=1 Tax=Hyperthermus butylicus (strain DSM 5456 / JCM 9403 / PLM1-5) TaxID=415426 RepID=A2BMK0_HYPBU|nr:porphobilinogen synthase [Hyperthermus butylicus]ABM81211.1 Delta-aminolevulinic acid dehydratase [Hyperthermus butylicus DSM 5456]